MNFAQQIMLCCLASTTFLAEAEVTRINLGPPVHVNSPCAQVEIKSLDNVSTRTANQDILVFIDVGAAGVNTFRVELEQCAAFATAATGLETIAANPPAASPKFKDSFLTCSKAKAALADTATVQIGIKPQCQWPDKLNSAALLNPVLSEPVFNAEFYMNTQDDIVKTLGHDLDKIVKQWRIYGISEGRRGSRAFDARFYLASHPDLVASFGSHNYYQAILHWLSYGLAEGRSAAFEFDPQFYLSRYPELRKAFGDKGYTAATMHWLTLGIKAGLQGSAQFDVAWYLANNQDLRDRFGANGYEAAFDQWVETGRAEGRKGIPPLQKMSGQPLDNL